MSGLLQQGIARVRAATSKTVKGTGFVVSRRHLVTCAHVVNESLGRRWDAPERPGSDDVVAIDLPYSSNPRADVLAQVSEWFPVAEAPISDIAVLELRSEVTVQPLRLARDPTSPGQPFSTIGFPIGQDGGMDAHGSLGASIEFGRLIAHGDTLPGFFLEGGYSGAPILDSESATVRGMAALAVRERERRTAFVLPTHALEYAWPPLARPYQGLAAFQESDARFFKGRERYVTELEEKLQKLPLIAVVGASGSGKSSLVRAGLLPLLHSQQNWRVLMFRPGAPSTQPSRTWCWRLMIGVVAARCSKRWPKTIRPSRNSLPLYWRIRKV
jgi:hypothetical protein